ncbi:flagella basal body P-ring formation protein FlgA [Aliidiomarina minuta]|uniref:Flagella basal body P-ring formation protein FlgA n=1 Tax=Aliidiomarina minuta TaxID=880057 RepID=A0A432W8E3_9GAMM|nr:flagellar basal body P-ring formation chaperone FlgA [Aliidiomarina minuta]RUO26403.1 flagella basal body P-ring formation protein FlgA [Aliidiomarina minuta]
MNTILILRTGTAALLSSLLLTLPAIAANNTIYQPERIAELAEEFVINQLAYASDDDRIEVSASTLDPRMGARQCQQPLDIELANNAGLERQTTVMIACHDRDNWRLYIPVRIQHMRAVVVSARQLSPGQVIGSSDLKINYIDINQLRDAAYTDTETLIGSQVKRRVGANQAIQERHTCFVCRGQDVTIISGNDGLQIRASGVARSDGLLGDRITVRNSRSNKDVQGVVSGTNEVRVGF